MDARWMLGGWSYCDYFSGTFKATKEGTKVEGNFHKIYRLDYNIPFPEPTITSDLRLSA